VEDDRQIAEQVDQQRHVSVIRDGEGNVAARDVAVDCQDLPANDVGTR